MNKMLFFTAVALCCVASGCVSAGKYRAKSDESSRYWSESQNFRDALEKLNGEKAAVDRALAQSQTDNKNLSDALSATSNKKDKMIGELTQHKQMLEGQVASLQKEKEESISSLKKTYDSLVLGMESEIKKGEIQITQLQGRLTVNMVDRILFNSGEAEVNAQGKKTLDKVGAILKKTADKQIRIEGHTDNVPISRELQSRYPTNWELSTARATTVARYLIDKTGVDPAVVAVAGYAETRPVESNDTPSGRAKNRRIEIVLIPVDEGAAPAE